MLSASSACGGGSRSRSSRAAAIAGPHAVKEVSSNKAGARPPRHACVCSAQQQLQQPVQSRSFSSWQQLQQQGWQQRVVRLHQQPWDACTAGRGHIVAASSSDVWTPSADDELLAAAQQLRALVDVLPELPDEVQGALAVRVPGLLELPAEAVRTRLEALAAALQLDLTLTAKLIGKVPQLWNRSPEAAAAKLSGISKAVGIDAAAAAALLMSAPTLAAVNMPGVVRDRVEALSDALGVSIAQAAVMVGRQSILWVIPHSDIRSPVPAMATALGLKQQDAAKLVERMPVLLACETSWLKLNISQLSTTSGLPLGALLELLSRSPALSSLSESSLLSGLEDLAQQLEVSLSDILTLLTQQPSLLLAKPAAILGAMDVLTASLRLPSLAAALGLLVTQPGLLYDITPASIAARLEQLGVVLACTADEARDLALQQPALLVIPPSLLQAALSSAAQQLGRPTNELQELLVTDPGAVVSLGYMGGPQGAAQTWSARLGLDAEAVAVLVAQQPALLEMSPNTLKARLESLAALFDVPSAAAAQLLLKHPALAAVPPNVTITRAKGLSVALKCSMARAGELIAKVPALLMLPGGLLGPSNLSGTPVETVLDICATYEFFTTQWLMAAAKERQPQTSTSFSGLHSSSS